VAKAKGKPTELETSELHQSHLVVRRRGFEKEEDEGAL
jgi:hypothetical protein